MINLTKTPFKTTFKLTLSFLLMTSGVSHAAQPAAATDFTITAETVPNTCEVGSSRTFQFGAALPVQIASETATSVEYTFTPKNVVLLTNCIPSSLVIIRATDALNGTQALANIVNTGTMGGTFNVAFENYQNWWNIGGTEVNENGELIVRPARIYFNNFTNRYGDVRGTINFSVTYE